ncbi:hypothetical protein HMPREF0201_00739 [Cedecea davisae DSM 4568]|uniref:Uncharacterized protein n=1 Tax=Cedecea davisae DSM 4568 TaxID=566551 RepID=S3K4Z7_9ENTR|nr:hypothetical protein HMPREF0201_00739 [Cedecea davisae DSM 4568]
MSIMSFDERGMSKRFFYFSFYGFFIFMIVILSISQSIRWYAFLLHHQYDFFNFKYNV